MAKVAIPPVAEKRLDRMRRERMVLELTALRSLAKQIGHLRAAVVGVVQRSGHGPWSLRAHARAMRHLRPLGRQLGGAVTHGAMAAAVDAAEMGIDHYLRSIAILGGTSRVPEIERGKALDHARPHLEARTHDVGARAGEAVGQAAVATSYLEAMRDSPPDSARVAALVGGAFALRARSEGERVLVTEVTAASGWGGNGAAIEVMQRFPKMRKYWDSTLDMRVCAQCAELHHVVVDDGDTFPGGLDDAPAHPRCRCCTGPWADDWTELMDALSVGPGPRTGVQEQAETRLPSFGTRAEYIDGDRPIARP